MTHYHHHPLLHTHIPLIEVVVRVQTQHVPVIQAKGFELPHRGVVTRSTGRRDPGPWHRGGGPRGQENSARFLDPSTPHSPELQQVRSLPELHSILEPPPLDDSLSGSNPPRTTTSLLAPVSPAVTTLEKKPSGKTNQPCRIQNITVWDPSPGKITFGCWPGLLASAWLLFSWYPGQPATALRRSPNTLRHSGIL